MGASALAIRSDAARRANVTRRGRELAAQLAVTDDFDKDPIRETVADFLAPFGGTVGDLHGATGASARAFLRRGVSVISADDGRYLVKKVDAPRDVVLSALGQMADQHGYRFYPGDLADVLSLCTSVFFDPCGPYLAPTSQMVQAIAAADLRAFAVTVELSRIEGGRGKGEAHYMRWAQVGLAEDAPQYEVVATHRYAGAAAIPMAVFLLERPAKKGEIGFRGCEWEDCTSAATRSRYGDDFWGEVCEEHYRASKNRQRSAARKGGWYDWQEAVVDSDRRKAGRYQEDVDWAVLLVRQGKLRRIGGDMVVWNGSQRRYSDLPAYAKNALALEATRVMWQKNGGSPADRLGAVG